MIINSFTTPMVIPAYDINKNILIVAAILVINIKTCLAKLFFK
jgi:hypothetical protein